MGTRFVLDPTSTEAMQATPQSSAASTSVGVSSGVRSAAARLLGAGNGSRTLSFVGSNGGNKTLSGTSSRIGSLGTTSSSNVIGNSNFDDKGSYLMFNVGDAIFISDLHSQDKVLNLQAMDKSRHWRIVGCSAYTGEGLLEGFNWLVQDIASRIYMLD